jgi:hypothetical protein
MTKRLAAHSAHAALRYFGIITCTAGGPGYEDANPASKPRGRAPRTLAVPGHQGLMPITVRGRLPWQPARVPAVIASLSSDSGRSACKQIRMICTAHPPRSRVPARAPIRLLGGGTLLTTLRNQLSPGATRTLPLCALLPLCWLAISGAPEQSFCVRGRRDARDRGGPPAWVLAEVTEISGLRRQPRSRRAYQCSAVRWNNMARSSSEKAEKIAS